MIAYSSSAQISYIFLALGLGSRAGTAAACFQLLTHAFTKPMIFVGAGALIRAGEGGHYWSDLRGMAWRAPVAGIGFTVGGLPCIISLLFWSSGAGGTGKEVLSCPQKRHRPTAGLPSASWRSTWCWAWG